MDEVTFDETGIDSPVARMSGNLRYSSPLWSVHTCKFALLTDEREARHFTHLFLNVGKSGEELSHPANGKAQTGSMSIMLIAGSSSSMINSGRQLMLPRTKATRGRINSPSRIFVRKCFPHDRRANGCPSLILISSRLRISLSFESVRSRIFIIGKSDENPDSSLIAKIIFDS